MKFARYTFLIGGVYGLIVMAPMYFMEHRITVEYPPALTHPEYFYAFIGVTVAWQILFLLVARDPVRYRLLMIPCVLEKASMLTTFLILFPQGRFPQAWIAPLIIDLSLGVLFGIAYALTRSLQRVTR